MKSDAKMVSVCGGFALAWVVIVALAQDPTPLPLDKSLDGPPGVDRVELREFLLSEALMRVFDGVTTPSIEAVAFFRFDRVTGRIVESLVKRTVRVPVLDDRGEPIFLERFRLAPGFSLDGETGRILFEVEIDQSGDVIPTPTRGPTPTPVPIEAVEGGRQ